MKFLLPLLLLACLSNSLYANDKSSGWVLEQYGNNELTRCVGASCLAARRLALR